MDEIETTFADLDTTPRASMQAHPQTPNPLAAAIHRRSQIYQRYSSIETIHPIVHNLRRSPAQSQIFQNAMANDYARWSEGSSISAASEISDFEAVFVKLMQSTKTHPGALALYTEELFGIRTAPYRQELPSSGHAVQVRTLFLNRKHRGTSIT
ncbi:MAG: hypothetical protein Q9222_000775 [Ikaeria aurantiellina]